MNRLATFVGRRLAARRLNVPFTRAANFTLPVTVRLHGRDVPLLLPQEHGVLVAFVELLLDDCYGLKRLALRGDTIETIIDIGANVGLFGLAARVAFQQATIHCYEPNTALACYIAHQARIARCDVFFEAVGSKPGRVSLTVDAAESVHSSTHDDPLGAIPQVALRTALERVGGSADIVKMDCEGAEWELLEDVESWRRVGFLSLEYHLQSGRDHEHIRSVLAGLGFAIERHTRASSYGQVLARQKAVRRGPIIRR